jgi:outer membrane receptor protein involved in Fe transport
MLNKSHVVAVAATWIALLLSAPLASRATQTADADANDSEGRGGLDEVVVTARRRAEKVQDVPIPITALSGSSLEESGQYRLEDLNERLPSLNAQFANPRQTSIAVRGLGNNPANDGLESSVGIYLDDVYLGRPGMANQDFVDIEQVSLLRGPQGTLFGKNTTAGVLNLTTRVPSFAPDGVIETSFGNYGYYQVRGTLSGPISVLGVGIATAVHAGPAERQAFYGDLHLHTSYSFDAYVLFGAKVDPDAAYRFARGESVDFLGGGAKRNEPLDFLAVTDHSENIGVFNSLDDPNSDLSKSEAGKAFKANPVKTFFDAIANGKFASGKLLEGVGNAKQLSQSAWQREIEAANRNYRPGTFTTFIAYEWTSMPDGQNLHRNVIFRGDKAPNPFTSVASPKPEDLWSWLDKIRKDGYEALAIPHNSNASNGLMFDWNDSNGRPIDQAYAEQRAADEPLVEIAQNKGASETHPILSPNDEFSNYEFYDHLLISQKKSKPEGSYVRDALGRGLEIAQRAGGVNPYKFGIIGASDFHNGLSASSEDAFVGTFGGIDPTRPLPSTTEFFKAFAEARQSVAANVYETQQRQPHGRLGGAQYP